MSCGVMSTNRRQSVCPHSGKPAHTDFGCHVIQLEDTRALKVPSFDEMKPMMQQSAQAQVMEKMVNALRAKAKID